MKCTHIFFRCISKRENISIHEVVQGMVDQQEKELLSICGIHMDAYV
jgi:hypothetical protein